MKREDLDRKVAKINKLTNGKFEREGFNNGHTLYDAANGHKTISPHLKSKAFGEWLDAFIVGLEVYENSRHISQERAERITKLLTEILNKH